MSKPLQETIELGPQERDRHLLNEYFCNDSEHKRALRDFGDSVLKEAQIPVILEDLANILKGRGTEIELDGRLMDDGTVEREIRWDPEDPKEGYGRRFKGITVKARTLNGDLIVCGERAELVEYPVWKGKSEVLIQAIADAYRSPACIYWPSSRMD